VLDFVGIFIKRQVITYQLTFETRSKKVKVSKTEENQRTMHKINPIL